VFSSDGWELLLELLEGNNMTYTEFDGILQDSNISEIPLSNHDMITVLYVAGSSCV
jgi:hypothetical protein